MSYQEGSFCDPNLRWISLGYIFDPNCFQCIFNERKTSVVYRWGLFLTPRFLKRRGEDSFVHTHSIIKINCCPIIFTRPTSTTLRLEQQYIILSNYRITPLITTVLITRFVYNHSVNYTTYNSQKREFIISALIDDNHVVIRKSDKY